MHSTAASGIERIGLTHFVRPIASLVSRLHASTLIIAVTRIVIASARVVIASPGFMLLPPISGVHRPSTQVSVLGQQIGQIPKPATTEIGETFIISIGLSPRRSAVARYAFLVGAGRPPGSAFSISTYFGRIRALPRSSAHSHQSRHVESGRRYSGCQHFTFTDAYTLIAHAGVLAHIIHAATAIRAGLNPCSRRS